MNNEDVYLEVLGYTTCEHGIYICENHCAICGDKINQEMLTKISDMIKELEKDIKDVPKEP